MRNINENMDLERILSNIPLCSKAELIKELQPGDILLTKLYDIDDSFFGRLKTQIYSMLSVFQKSPYVSSKMYLGNGKVGGYGAVPGAGAGAGILQFPVSPFLDAQRRVLLIRPKDFTDEQREKAVKYIKQRIGLSYDSSALLKSAWHKWVRENPKLAEKMEDKEDLLEIYRDPLICSTILYLALIYSGNKSRLKSHPLDAWPVDFIESPDMEKIYRYEK